ncbi:MAG: hypothetical protein EOQ33_26855 [Mesorhizobium sp.]|nr:MAG: hypothetical protein EOQ33_26855 [Mesorhizobium sp.]
MGQGDPGLGAAPHLPAGILSPYSDGERGAVINGFANIRRCRICAEAAASFFLPVTMRGEMPGRAMRGGADVDNCKRHTLNRRRAPRRS